MVTPQSPRWFTLSFGPFQIRPWQPGDRVAAAQLIASVLSEYGLGWEPQGADVDVVDVEGHYWQRGGEFWVIEAAGKLVGTAGYYPIEREPQAVEIRKMYLLPAVRGQGLGRHLLKQLEAAIQQAGYPVIWIETASVLEAAVRLYETSGYQPAIGVATQRCDRVYIKRLGQG